MNSLNSILVEGNLVKDPESGATPRGTEFCHFTLASNRYFQQEQERKNEVSYFDVEVWSKQALVCQEHLTKGRGVRVVGRLKQDRWEDDKGQSHSRVKIIAEHVEFKPQFQKEGEGSKVPARSGGGKPHPREKYEPLPAF